VGLEPVREGVVVHEDEEGGSPAGAVGVGQDDLRQPGVEVGPWGPSGEQRSSGLTQNVTGHVRQAGRGGCLHAWQFLWPLWRRGRGG